jgi:hypothetical protein
LHTTWSSDHDLWTVLQSLHVITDVGSTDTGMAFDREEVANSHYDFLDLLCKFAGRGKNQSLTSFEIVIDFLESGDREGSGLASAGLGLCDDIGAFDDWHDGALEGSF